MMRFVIPALLAAAVAAPATSHAPPVPRATMPPAPFAVGETLRYEARVGFVTIGSAVTTVTGTAQVRGAETYVFTATAQGGMPGFGAQYDLTSWTGWRGSRFVSRRFYRRADQAGRVDEHRFDIVADSGLYREEGNSQAWATPPDALDELGFLYWLRTAALAPGADLSLSRYFRTGYNPVHVTVTGREPVTLGSGETVNCLAITVSAAGASSQLWLTDDARRLPAQLRLPLPYGQVTLRLQALPPR